MFVTDCNDFPTLFSSASFAFSLDETIVPSTSDVDVYSGIVVSDADQASENRARAFSIVGAPASTNNWFGINSTNVRYVSNEHEVSYIRS